jgi:hypothetical protein
MEDDAAVGLRGEKRQSDRSPSMNADAVEVDARVDRVLMDDHVRKSFQPRRREASNAAVDPADETFASGAGLPPQKDGRVESPINSRVNVVVGGVPAKSRILTLCYHQPIINV